MMPDGTLNNFAMQQELNRLSGMVDQLMRRYGDVEAAASAGGGSSGTVGAVFEVLLTQTGGVAGNGTVSCSFTYTVERLDGVTIGTGLGPDCPRIDLVPYTAATRGLACFNTDGSVRLVMAFEKPGGCS